MSDQSEQYEKIQFLLTQLQCELRRLGLAAEPLPAAVPVDAASGYGYNTLMLRQWLQWVCLPMLEQDPAGADELSAESGLAEYAQIVLAQSELDVAELRQILQTLQQQLQRAGDRS